jgi:hypothetical protein
MATPPSIEYLCLCGWRSDAEPNNSQCPQCEALVAISVVSAIERSADDQNTAPEMIFPTKQVFYKWPRGFWHRIGERLEQGEIVINPRTMGLILQQVAPRPHQKSGQKPGPMLVTSPEEFRQQLQDNLAQFKEGERVNKTTLAMKCRWSRGTLYNYAALFKVNVQAYIEDFRRARRKRT